MRRWIGGIDGRHLDYRYRLRRGGTQACRHRTGHRLSPCAPNLAVPLVVAITTALSARNGILVRDRLALEAARELIPLSLIRPAR